MPKRLQFDANAGSAMNAVARAAFIEALDGVANASSVHAEGRRARDLVETARARVACAVGAESANVVFTSSATEAAPLALSQRFSRGGATVDVRRLYVGATEHPCVLAGGRFAPEKVSTLPVDACGTLDLAALEAALEAHDDGDGPFLLALMLANNESGVIHPVAAAARLVRARGGIVFSDAVQALGRVPLKIDALGVDMLSLSAHKIGGPQGVGALVFADAALRPEPLLRGGGQEGRMRAGTENVAAIHAFGVAAAASAAHMQGVDVAAVRDAVEAVVLSIAPEARILGVSAERLPNTSLVLLPGIAAELLVIGLDLEGVAVSAGSACSSGKVAESHVVRAMGGSVTEARQAIRISLPAGADMASVDCFAAAFGKAYTRFRLDRAA